MAHKDNIISLEDHLRRKQEAEAGEEGGGQAEAAAAGAGDGEEGEQRAEAVEAVQGDAEALPGKLVWLHCPACDTLQYTELVMAGGRQHNECGNQVEEIELDIDVRAEYTIAEINLERLRMLGEAVQAQQRRYQEYQDRLRLITGGEVAAYPVSADTVQKLPVAEVDAMGLLISTALHDPARHFAQTPASIPIQTPTPARTPNPAPADETAGEATEPPPEPETEPETEPPPEPGSSADPESKPPKP